MIINKINFPIYYIIDISSIIIGLLYIILSLKEKINKKDLIKFSICFLILSITLAKILTMLTSKNPISFFKAGLSGYGGLIGAISTSIIFEKFYLKEKGFIKYTVISLSVIYSLSKISCFLIGCCHGLPYNGIFNVRYTELNQSFIPIQLIEVFTFMFIFQICRLKHNEKYITYKTLLLITSTKFLLDFFRYEHINTFITFNQIFSIILFTIVLIIYILKQKKD